MFEGTVAEGFIIWYILITHCPSTSVVCRLFEVHLLRSAVKARNQTRRLEKCAKRKMSSSLRTSYENMLLSLSPSHLINWKLSKAYFLASDKAGFERQKYDSYKCWTYAELCEAYDFLMEFIYAQFADMVHVHQYIMVISMDTNCAPLKVDLPGLTLNF